MATQRNQKAAVGRAAGLDGDLRYRRVKTHILSQVADGRLAAGDKVASENELTRRLKVSRMTAHRALRELSAEGVLRRVRGLGTFVSEPKPQTALLEIRNIADEIAQRGHRHSAGVALLRDEAADEDIAEALGLPVGARVYHSILVHREDGKPAQVEDRHVNPAFAPAYLDQDFARTTPYAYLTALGPLDAAEHVIEAVRPDSLIRRLLDVRADEPCLFLTRRTWSNGLVVSRARLTHAGSRYRLAGRQDY
jgi:GntR family histidine utilization transcriptional repressor